MEIVKREMFSKLAIHARKKIATSSIELYVCHEVPMFDLLKEKTKVRERAYQTM